MDMMTAQGRTWAEIAFNLIFQIEGWVWWKVKGKYLFQVRGGDDQ